MQSTQIKLENEIVDASEKMKSSVRNLMKETNGTALLKQVLTQIKNEKGSTMKIQNAEQESEPTQEGPIVDASYTFSPESTNSETEETLPDLLPELSGKLERATWESTDLLTSSAKRLHRQLERMLPDEGEDQVRTADVHTIDVACRIANQITNLMRLKLDVLKFSKSIQPK